MNKIKGEKRNYVLTPISSVSYNAAPSLSNGFSKLASMGKKGIIATLAILSLLTVMFVSGIQTTKPAYADWTTDSFCNNTIGSLYSDYGYGFVPSVPTQADGAATLLRSASTAATTNATIPLTAYEEYGFSFMNYTSWVSATVDSDLSKKPTVFNKYAGYDAATQRYSWTEDATTVPKVDAAAHPSYWAAGIWDCTNASGAIVNGIANTYLSVSKFGVSVVNTVYLMVFGGGNLAFKTVYEGIGTLVSGLKDSFFMPYLELMVLMGAVWMGYQGLVKRRSTEALQGAIWMICAAAAGTLLIANPLLIPNVTNSIVTTVNKSINDAITSNPMSTATEGNALCSIDGNNGSTAANYDITDAINGKSIYSDGTDLTTAMSDITSLTSTTRETQCMIWYNVLYTPWVAGQYGSTPPGTAAADDASKLYVKNTPSGKALVTNGNETIPVYLGSKVIPAESLTWPLLQLDSQKASTGVATGGLDYYNAISSATAVSQLVDNNNGTWTGKGLNMERPSAAFASIFSMIGTGVLVITYGLEMLAYQLGMLFLIILMPVFLLIGVHPGMGRRIALRWAELIGNLAIKQILIGILLSVFLMIYGLVLGGGLWLVSNILIVAVTIVGLTYKKTIMNMFASLQFGGSKALDDPMNQIITGSKRVMGAAVGAGIGAAAAGVGMGKLAAAGVGGVAQAAAGGNTVAPAVQPAVAPEGGTGSPVSLPASTPETPVAPAPSSGTVPPTVVKKDSADEARLKQLKREHLKKAMMMGASQGFASGKIGTTAFTAAQLGLQIGDNAYDNEVAYQENLRDDIAREQQNAIAQQEREARNAEIKAAQEAKAARDAELSANLKEFNANFKKNNGGNTPNSK